MENTNTSVVKEEQTWQKVVKIVVNVIFYILIFLLLLFSIANLNKKDQYSVPSLFGKGFTTVETPSMAGNEKDSFTMDDLVFLSVVTDKNRDKKVNSLKVGDIICFKAWNAELRRDMLNTHRIVEIHYDDDGSVHEFITKGDANEVRDSVEVSLEDIRGIYTGKWVGAGKAMKFLQTSLGFGLCIVLPVALFFIAELVILILRLNKIKKDKNDQKHEAELEALREAQAKALEEEKARIRAEILAEQAKASEAEDEAEELDETEENKETEE